MGRANNVARSLIILSKLRGWDPCTIDGKPFMNNEYPEDQVTSGSLPRMALPTSPQSSAPTVNIQGPDTRHSGAVGEHHGKHNPYAGK